jgi:Fur family ferric uptake transcriptional regulator
MMDKIQRKTRRILSGSQKRATSQRVLLLGLIQRSNGHVDADELHRQARKKYPRISLSTVYRNLQVFSEMGLIEKLHFDEEHHHYEVTPATEHHHLLCVDCGRIVEFTLPLRNQLHDEVSRQFDFEIDGIEVQVTGVCSSCRRKKKDKV